MQYDWCAYKKKEIWLWRHRHTAEKATGRQRQSLECCIYNPKNDEDCHQPPEARRHREGLFYRGFGESMTLQTP